AEARLEPPQYLAGLRVKCQHVAIGLAMENEAACCGSRAAAVTEPEWCLELPSDLVGVAADRGEGAAHHRVDRCRLGAARVSLAFQILTLEPGESAGAHSPGHIEEPEIRVVRHRRPVGAAHPRGLDQHRLLPEDRK